MSEQIIVLYIQYNEQGLLHSPAVSYSWSWMCRTRSSQTLVNARISVFQLYDETLHVSIMWLGHTRNTFYFCDSFFIMLNACIEHWSDHWSVQINVLLYLSTILYMQVRLQNGSLSHELINTIWSTIFNHEWAFYTTSHLIASWGLICICSFSRSLMLYTNEVWVTISCTIGHNKMVP